MQRRARFLGISSPDLRDEEIEEVLDTIRSGWLISGPKVQRLQQGLSEYIGAQHVRCLNSCTAGLMLALRLSGIGAGDEVLVPANTFVSCANAVELSGARPVFVDCDPRTGLLDLELVDALVGPRTRALMPVHLGGRPADMDAVAELRDRHGLTIIEDGAHAIGAAWRGRRIGGWGNMCSFSFHATKNMTTFEGGALVVADEDQAARVQRLALHGLSRSAWTRHGTQGPARYDVLEPGFKMSMTDVAAAVGIHQLARLDGWIERREALCCAYDELLSALPLDLPAPVEDGSRHARHLYTVVVRPNAAATRDDLVVALNQRNIGTTVHFRGIHLQTYYRDRYRLRAEDLPCATDWSERALTLPLHPQLQHEDLARVAEALTDILGAR